MNEMLQIHNNSLFTAPLPMGEGTEAECNVIDCFKYQSERHSLCKRVLFRYRIINS